MDLLQRHAAPKMRLQFGALGVTMSWDDGFLGARASRPHQARHSLGHLLHLDQPATAPWLSFGLADGVPAGRVAACGIALKLSGSQRDSMRAGRPRSRARPSRRQGGCLQHCTEAQRRPKGQHAGGTPALPGKAVPAAPCGSFEGKRLIISEDEPPMDTNKHE